MTGNLYLIPVDLGNDSIDEVIPQKVLELTRKLDYFIVEDIRTARRYLSKIKTGHCIDDIRFSILNEHSKSEDIASLLKSVVEGHDVGVMSEAGLPGLADPGADVVRIAHEKGIRVIPLVGPSSIFMALIASGMNGQNFAFVGYLPVKPKEREQRIWMLESRSLNERQSQLFIEAPYRNNQLLTSLLSVCRKNTRLCIAYNISHEDEFIVTKTIGAWKKQTPDLHKKPCLFILNAGC
ncbi:MAG: SAM-dependent methyltransferase [Prevotellaceae bacterium]|jgi:16S rRNA (cytidine1402-2'-O)-methyltransferase|nr:SAM-dependent methyltransferase [Prevotellaceae bacterium]